MHSTVNAMFLLTQEDIGYKARRALEGKMEALRAVHREHKQNKKDRDMAVRYHRVSSALSRRSQKLPL